MRYWKMTLAYDGTAYHGWQVQPGLPTVQGRLAAALKLLTGETVLPQGSGRTDAGVHALGQVVSFGLEAPIPGENLLRALNRALPGAIRVLSVEAVEAEFHARRGAVRKTYEYRLFPRVGVRPERICSPMLAAYVWDCPWEIDLGRAEAAARVILGEHDFSSFAASDPDRTERLSGVERSNVRTVYESGWSELDGLMVYRVVGNGFLHHMVRNLVGCFVDAACGRTEVSEVAGILAAKDRTACGATAPASGLFLVGVEY
ncbi:tRNA pseudouridine synthase A [Granulicella tundricola MP5ACTX9]|uniref:tRNA pseudouridine synthase A n=2 Tax=Granulicella TaxID=940557 RepID=E8WYA8_GRATM|nr:tRNA pseudouridine synthase A [Granulicella tundricola MP5ACTX9]